MNEELLPSKTITVYARAITSVNPAVSRQKLNRITKDLLYKEYMIEILDSMLSIWRVDVFVCDTLTKFESPYARLYFFQKNIIDKFMRRISIATFVIHNQTNKYVGYINDVVLDYLTIDASHFYIGLKIKNGQGEFNPTIWLFRITFNPNCFFGARFVVNDAYM